MADASVTTSTPDAAAGKPIDVETVTTGVGTVNRQVVAIGDPATGGNRATVEAASTPIAATDLPLAVGLHPSSPLPAGTNAIGALTANQSVNVNQVGGAALTEGQKAMAASVPVAIASDQSAVPVSGTVTTTPPANASTNLAQVGGAAISEGQKAMAASVPVVVASDQSALPVSGTVTGNQGTALAQTVAGWPVQPWGMADTLFAGANVANPAAAAAIATLTTPSAGTYRIDFSCYIYTANVAAGQAPDMELRKGAVVQISALGGISAALDGATVVGQAGTVEPFRGIRMTLDGATSVSINATAGAAAANYVAHLIATRIF